MTQDTQWIAVDWGTSNLRLWIIGANGEVLDHRHSDKGMGQLSPSDFEPTLLALTEDALPASKETTVLICGMAGAKQGWFEAPYVATPCAPPGLSDATKVPCKDARLNVYILPGVKQIDPPDVMRGEETQIAGFLKQNPSFSGLLCLPGTHTKWARINDGCISSFRTFMTGELFALLSTKSVLRFSVDTEEFDNAAFEKAVRDISAHPLELTSNLFSLRAAGLVAGQSPGAAKGALSGLLIGSEVKAITQNTTLEQIAILGSDGISNAYLKALKVLGFDADLHNAETITLFGLQLAHAQHQD